MSGESEKGQKSADLVGLRSKVGEVDFAILVKIPVVNRREYVQPRLCNVKSKAK